jgi:hypothetical protein
VIAMTNTRRAGFRFAFFAVVSLWLSCESQAKAQPPAWGGYQQNPQHTGISTYMSNEMQQIAWSTAVDLNPQYTSSGALLAHYGSPLITAANTVIVPVKTGATDGFMIRAFNGADGSLLWSQATNYSRPASSWVPSYSPTLTPTNRLYYATAGGTISYRDGVDTGTATGSGQIAFFGDATYAANQAAYNANVKVNTPITSDALGNIYFGYQVINSSAVGGLTSGIARIGADGSRTFMAASTYDAAMTKLTMNNAPALSNDGQTLYFTMNAGTGQNRLVSVNANNLSLINKVNMIDPGSGNGVTNTDVGTSSVTVAPDGRVFIGVMRNPNTNSKGWMMQYDGALTTTMTPGAFGWDITPSIIPESVVDAMRAAGTYTGTSDYLIMTKYNDYAGLGGTGINRLAILDPNATQVTNGVTVMKEVITIAGVTPDQDFPNNPDAVREWCINAAAVDPFKNSVLVNSEDGKIYRWDLLLNIFTEVVTLTDGLGQAYTPTVVGADGKVYAISNATLFALGPVPEAATILMVGVVLGGFIVRRRFGKASGGR